jgi:hypothetical protein
VVKRKIPTPLPGLEPPIVQPVAQPYTTELYQLNINIYIQEMWHDVVNWIYTPQGRLQWQVVLNTVVNLSIHKRQIIS